MTCSPKRKHEHIISTTPYSLPTNLSSNSPVPLNTLLLLFSPLSTHHCNIYLDTFTVSIFQLNLLRLTAWERFIRSLLEFSTHSLLSSSRQNTQSIKASLISVSKKHHVISCFHWLWEFEPSLLSSSLLLSRGKCPYTSRTPKIDCCLHINPTHNQSDISCIFTSYHHAIHYGQSHYLPEGTEVTNNTNFSQDSPWTAKLYVVTCLKCQNMWIWTSLSPMYQIPNSPPLSLSLVWGKIFRVANIIPGCEMYKYRWSQPCSQYTGCYRAGNMAVPFFVFTKEEHRPRVKFISRKCARCWNSSMFVCSVVTMLLLGEVFVQMERKVQEMLDVTCRALGMRPNINQPWVTRRSLSHVSQEQKSHYPRNCTKTKCQPRAFSSVQEP